MHADKKIKVLVVDDSLVFREIVAKGIASDKAIEVVGVAADPFIARDKIIDLEPDVLTLDVEMPRMNGIEFLKRLMPQYPIPVVVVSAVSENVFDALDAGAVDFVTKPDARTPNALETFMHELIVKIKIASTAKMRKMNTNYINSQANYKNLNYNNAIIGIGASTGGTEAIFEVVKTFSRDIPGVVIVQHMPPVFTRMYAQRLNDSCLVEVKEAENDDAVLPGGVLIAPGDYHMKINGTAGKYYVECCKGPKVNGHCPSVDVLFDSLAEKAGSNAIGVILTGMGYDGARGLLNMRKKGAVTIGQDEQSCVVYGMPKVAYDIGAVERQAPLNNISGVIYTALANKL